ncbi:hypothetical protein DL764_003343 [Monosporascus ibericus]|uniref:Uncharacterized protein n=1 Tax=Monosporascus ibericus TaxID=155417 RepID=A0A4Q4TGW4_9PEZI|nr:hypothetical protein DL764_003343 [Monosporascus ibericus]
MKVNAAAVALSGATLAMASPLASQALFRRTDYDVCTNDCTLFGTPAPDEDTFNRGPIAGYQSDRDYKICIDGTTTCSTARLEFVGLNLVVSFLDFGGGYTYDTAGVFLQKLGATAPTSVNPNYLCTTSGSIATCTIPFTSITGLSTTDVRTLFGAMCPKGDREALEFYIAFSGTLKDSSSTVSFHQDKTCTSYTSGTCTAWCDDCIYNEMAYRCTNCNVPCPSTTSLPTLSTAVPTLSTTPPTPTSTPSSCDYGTAFGYQDSSKSFTFQSITTRTQGCKRWGWYEQPCASDLASGISGSLLVGAGRNDISKATNVGTWTAKLTGGLVTVTYSTTGSYLMTEVHVEVKCPPITKCAPGQYIYNSGSISTNSYTTIPGITYPTCARGAKPVLIIHAAISQLSTTACPSPIAT